MKLSNADKAFVFWIYGVLIGLGFVTLYPFWNAVVISLNSGGDTAMGGVTIWPREFTLDNYQIVLSDERLYRAFVISVGRTIVGTFFSILLTMMVAYGLSKSHTIFYKYYMIFFILTLFFTGGLIPSFLINRTLGLMDNYLVMIIPVLINVWNMIIFRTFFKQLPDGLEESARIDGCSNFGVLFRIVVPISGPVIATLSLFTAVMHWNDWFTATIYINKQNMMPLQTLLNQILTANLAKDMLIAATGGNTAAIDALNRSNTVSNRSLSMTIMIVATLPIIMVYPFLQKYFVKGVLVGSIKG